MQSEPLSVSELVKRLIESEEQGSEGLARRFGVSTATLTRWASGSGGPRPTMEGKIRSLAEKWHVSSNQDNTQKNLFDLPSNGKEDQLRETLRATLQQAREVLHRSGRLSSRHEALDELSKLLFAHIISIDTNGDGINRKIVNKGSSAYSLRHFVSQIYQLHLPTSLSHELGPDDFQLRIKDSEDRFANELIECFERLASPGALSQLRGAGGVDVLNETFGQFLADSFTDEKELGQYLTPTEAVQFMVRLGLSSLDPEDINALCDPKTCAGVGYVLDPSCGVGSLLAETLRVLQERVRYQNNGVVPPGWVSSMLNSTIVGIDKSERMIKLALTNLAMFGAPAVNLHLANSLVRSGQEAKVTSNLENRAKLILTNPPFGAEFDAADLSKYKLGSSWAKRSFKSAPSELLFMERYIDWLAPGGVLIAIVPDSVLTNRGIFEDLRNGIADSVQLQSVISLPSVTFGVAGTTTKTSIIHLKKLKRHTSNPSSVYFSICKNIGYEVSTRSSQRRKVFSGESDLITILKEACHECKPKIGRAVTLNTMETRWDAAYHASLPIEIHQRITTSSDLLRVRDIAFLSNERANPERRGDEHFEYIEISDVEAQSCLVSSKLTLCSEAPSRARKVVKAGDVLVSTVRPERRALGVVPNHLNGAICSTGFAVLRCTGVNPLVLAKLLQSDFCNLQLLRNNIGIAYPAIDEACILETVLPVSAELLESFRSIAQDIESTRIELEVKEKKFELRLSEVTDKWLDK